MTTEILIKLCIAVVCGGLVGLERDIHHKAAGFRTHILVCLGATVFTILSSEFHQIIDGQDYFSHDPARISSAIVTGIGFIGAGAVMKSGYGVHGITTAASLWISAAIGMAIGIGFFEIAVVSTFLALFTLFVLNKVEQLFLKHSYRRLTVTFKDTDGTLEKMHALLAKKARVQRYSYTKDLTEKTVQAHFILKILARGVTDIRSHAIEKDIRSKIKGVKKISWEWS